MLSTRLKQDTTKFRLNAKNSSSKPTAFAGRKLSGAVEGNLVDKGVRGKSGCLRSVAWGG